MMLIASLIELGPKNLKPDRGQKVKIQLANFDKARLRVIWFRWAALLSRHSAAKIFL
jgi:hypothetical protein